MAVSVRERRISHEDGLARLPNRRARRDPAGVECAPALIFSTRGGIDLHNWRQRDWKPALGP
jgi:hypothetical protein